jgi:hypothetical protein
MSPTPPVPSLTSADGLIVVGVMVIGMLLAGVMVYFMRKPAKGDPNCPSGSMIRSWIAAALVMGLLVLCAGAFLLKDAATRSTLFGGLISSVGAAVAFYFSSKSTEQAQDALASAHGIIATQTAAGGPDAGGADTGGADGGGADGGGADAGGASGAAVADAGAAGAAGVADAAGADAGAADAGADAGAADAGGNPQV